MMTDREYIEQMYADVVAEITAEVRERIAAEQAAWECDDPWTCCIAAHRDIARQRERGQSASPAEDPDQDRLDLARYENRF